MDTTDGHAGRDDVGDKVLIVAEVSKMEVDGSKQ